MTPAFQVVTCPQCLGGAYSSFPGSRPPCRVSADRAIIVRLAPKRVRRRSRKDSMFDRMKMSTLRSMVHVLYKMIRSAESTPPGADADSESLHKRAMWPVSTSSFGESS